MLASGRNGTLYVGVTSDLIKRVYEHRSNAVEGFTNKYGVHDLVWYELHCEMASSITREKQIKRWARSAKVQLIEKNNPQWLDLWMQLV